MNKEQFIYNLRQKLQDIDSGLLKEILADFEEHFASGLASGKSEEEIAADLGEPADIASQYRDTISEGQSHQVVRATWQYQDPAGAVPAGQPVSTPAMPERAAATSIKKKNDAMLLAVILFNLFIGIPIWIGLFSVLLGLWTTAGGIGIAACVLFAVAIIEAGITSLILALFGLSLTALTVLGAVLLYYLSKLLVILLGHYIRYNKQLAMGGAPS